jgi:hypothetical protein
VPKRQVTSELEHLNKSRVEQSALRVVRLRLGALDERVSESEERGPGVGFCLAEHARWGATMDRFLWQARPGCAASGMRLQTGQATQRLYGS